MKLWGWWRDDDDAGANGEAVREVEAEKGRLDAARRRRAQVEFAADQFAAMIERALRGGT